MQGGSQSDAIFCLQVDGLITGGGGGLISAGLQFYCELRSHWSVPAKLLCNFQVDLC